MTDADARAQVEHELTHVRGEGANIQPIADAALGRVFPDCRFFLVLFRMYPIARMPPLPLKSTNVYVVCSGEKKPRLMTDTDELRRYFIQGLKNRTFSDAAQIKDLVRAWLELACGLSQDGFFEFTPMDESTKVSRHADGMEATGKAVAMKGGNGQVEVRLDFDGPGHLQEIHPSAKIRPGPRPICQATKLLDPDPIVRAMAEQDLLIMGRPARPYLEEQHRDAGPELRQAIDRIWARIQKEDR